MRKIIEVMHLKRPEADHRKRLVEAFIDWGTIPRSDPSLQGLPFPNPPLPDLTFDEAVDWACYAWWLRHEAWHTRRGRRPEEPAPPFTPDDKTRETIIFAPDYWQRRYRERKAAKDILEMASRPLPKVRIVAGQTPGWLRKQPLKSDIVMVAEEDMDTYLPEEIGLILTGRITDKKELEAVLKYQMDVEARYRVRIQELKALALGYSYQRGLQDGQPHVPNRPGPRADTQLERALHRHAMVRYLASRFAGTKEMTRLYLDQACHAVAEATGCEYEAIEAACKRAAKHFRSLFPADL